MRKNIVTFILLFAFAVSQRSFAQIKPAPVYKTYRVAIIAPLFLDSIFTGYHLKSENSIPKYSISGADFVQGAELALDTLNLKGRHLEAFIFDSKSATHSVTTLIKSGKLDHIDLIIGSVKPPEYYPLAQFALEKKIPFISAIYPNDGGIRKNPFLLIANSTLKTHCEAIFSYILQKHGTDNIYLIHKKNDNRILNYFKDINLVDGKPLLKIKDIMLDSSVSSQGMKYLVDTTKPIVIIGASLDQTFSQKLADACYPIQKTNPLVLFGMPNWDGFPRWYKRGAYPEFSISYTTPHYLEKSNAFGKYLSNKYFQLYNIDPSDMVEKGFAITYNFTSILINFPGSFMQNVNDTLYAPLHNFNFKPVYHGNNSEVDYYENKHLFIMQILNGEVVREW
ncbi:MAG: ABC transporter substrate-binding protein [Ginsengibacter sp.]